MRVKIIREPQLYITNDDGYFSGIYTGNDLVEITSNMNSVYKGCIIDFDNISLTILEDGKEDFNILYEDIFSIKRIQ